MSAAVDRLLRSLAPEVVDALLELVDERIAAATDGQADRTSPWLSLAEAADHLRVSARTIERMIACGRLRSITVGRRRLVHRDDLNRAAAGEEAAPTAPPRHRRH